MDTPPGHGETMAEAANAAPTTPQVVASNDIACDDGRQSQAALAIARGSARLLLSLGLASLAEVMLPNGRRADLMALSTAGNFWIVEVKSSIADFRADQKWPEYRDYCDGLLFAVGPDFPIDILPPDTGLIIADRYGGELQRPAPEHRLPAARRRALLLRFARTSALRQQSAADPELVIDPGVWSS